MTGKQMTVKSGLTSPEGEGVSGDIEVGCELLGESWLGVESLEVLPGWLDPEVSCVGVIDEYHDANLGDVVDRLGDDLSDDLRDDLSEDLSDLFCGVASEEADELPCPHCGGHEMHHLSRVVWCKSCESVAWRDDGERLVRGDQFDQWTVLWGEPECGDELAVCGDAGFGGESEMSRKSETGLAVGLSREAVETEVLV